MDLIVILHAGVATGTVLLLATLGEISDRLRQVFGVYRQNFAF